jgi:hypothetical protein
MCLAAGSCSLTSMLALFGFFHQSGPSTPLSIALLGAFVSTMGGILLVVAGMRARSTRREEPRSEGDAGGVGETAFSAPRSLRAS